MMMFYLCDYFDNVKQMFFCKFLTFVEKHHSQFTIR
jgi:hypothetical protein